MFDFLSQFLRENSVDVRLCKLLGSQILRYKILLVTEFCHIVEIDRYQQNSRNPQFHLKVAFLSSGIIFNFIDIVGNNLTSRF